MQGKHKSLGIGKFQPAIMVRGNILSACVHIPQILLFCYPVKSKVLATFKMTGLGVPALDRTVVNSIHTANTYDKQVTGTQITGHHSQLNKPDYRYGT